jgi:Rad3-related DNA helicase
MTINRDLSWIDKEWPYHESPPKEIQIEIAQHALSSLGSNQIFILSAPMRAGKTAPIFLVCLKHLKKDEGAKIFWLSGYHRTFLEPQKVMLRLSCPYAVFIGKKRMCAIIDKQPKNAEEFADFCDRARRYDLCDPYRRTLHSNRPSGEEDVLTEEACKVIKKTKSTIKRKEKVIGNMLENYVAETCQRYNLCPYEIMVAIARDTDVIIGDYYYVFGDVSKLFLPKLGADLRKSIVVIDEADLFLTRIEEQVGDNITDETFAILKKEVETVIQKFKKMLDTQEDTQIKNLRDFLINGYEEIKKVEGAFVSFCKSKLASRSEVKIEKDEFEEWMKQNTGKTCTQIANSLETISDTLLQNYKKPLRPDKFFMKWASDIEYGRLLKAPHKARVNYELKLVCLDIARTPIFFHGGEPIYLKDMLLTPMKVIFLSATLGDPSSYASEIGLEPTSVGSYVSDTFFIHPDNILVIIDVTATSLYSRRGDQANLRAVRETLEIVRNVTSEKGLKTHWYTASESFAQAVGEIKGLEAESLFKTETRGITLEKGSLVITGVPIEQISLKDNLKREMIQRRLKNEEETEKIMATRPMSRVVQTMGRIFTQEPQNNRGLIVLSDQRYAQEKFLNHIPLYFRKSSMIIRSKDQLDDVVRDFWLKERASSDIISKRD